MKHLFILTLVLLSSCVFDGEEQDLSSIEQQQELLQTKVDSLSNIQTKVDTLIITDSIYVKDTLVVKDSMYNFNTDTLVVYDTLVVKDTTWHTVNIVGNVYMKSAIVKLKRSDFVYTNGNYGWEAYLISCPEFDHDKMEIQFSSNMGYWSSFSDMETLVGALAFFSYDDCTFYLGTAKQSAVNYILANAPYVRIIRTAWDD